MPILTIKNDGQRITATNYWQTPQGRAGGLYLSVNAGAFRLLVPASSAADLRDALRTARHAVVSRGPWPDAGVADAFEVLLDDGTESPWCCHIQAAQCDRLLPVGEHGRTDLRLLVYAPGPVLVGEVGARYRASGRLPDLSRWRG